MIVVVLERRGDLAAVSAVNQILALNHFESILIIERISVAGATNLVQLIKKDILCNLVRARSLRPLTKVLVQSGLGHESAQTEDSPSSS